MAEFTFPTDPMEICPCLFNTESYLCRCVGYCEYHKAYLTQKQLKTKNCLGKQCKALIKQNDHPFWVERALKKSAKKQRKEEDSAILDLISGRKAVRPEVKNFSAVTSDAVSLKKKEPVQKQKRYICLDLEMSELTFEERKSVQGLRELKGEVIQIGGVLLDENFNCLSHYMAYVKPDFGGISEEITRLTGITDDMVANADSFCIALRKLQAWAGAGKITTFCWSDSDYKQLWNEIHVKVKHPEEYRAFLNTFVDLQAGFNHILGAQKSLSLDAALNLCHLGFKGLRHTADADALNTARILHKISTADPEILEYPKRASDLAINPPKRFNIANIKESDFTASVASFIAPELLQQFGYSNPSAEENVNGVSKKQCKVTSRFIRQLSKKVPCIKYGVKAASWYVFSAKMLFIRDMNVAEGAAENGV